jgi:hypothetical protein
VGDDEAIDLDQATRRADRSAHHLRGELNMANLDRSTYFDQSDADYNAAMSELFALKQNYDSAGNLAGPLDPALAQRRHIAEVQNAVEDFVLECRPRIRWLRYGSGNPEGEVTAPPGTIYVNTDGGAGTTFWIKETGTDDAGWISVTTESSGDSIAIAGHAALSVIGRSANSSGVAADIAFGTDGFVLRRSGSSVAAGLLTAGAFATGPGIVTPAMMDNASARSVVGRAANSGGARADIVGTGSASDIRFLGDDGTTASFRSLTLATVGDQVIVDIDATTEASSNWQASDGSHTFGGFTWTTANGAAANTWGPDGSTGVRFNAATTSTVYTDASRTATYMRILASTLLGSAFELFGTYLIEAYFSSLTLGTTPNRVLIGLDLDTASATDRFMGGGRRNTSGTQQLYTQQAASMIGDGSTLQTIAVKVEASSVSTYGGTYSAGFPNPYTKSGGIQAATDSYCSVMDPQSYIVIAHVTGEAGGNMDDTLARLRVKRVRG